MQYLQKIKEFINNHRVISGIVALVLIFILFKWYQAAHSTTGKIQYVTQAAAKTTILSSVTATGQVSAQNKIDLKPGGSGQVAEALTAVNVKQGDQVKAGEIIATADEKNNNVTLIQARASLASAQASYDNLMAGLTGTDLQSAQLSVTTSQQALDKAKRDYDNTIITQKQAVDKAYSDLLNVGLVAITSDASSTATVSISGTYTGTQQGEYIINLLQAGDGLHYQATNLGSGNGLISRGNPQSIGNGLYITFGTTGTLSSSTSWTISIPNQTSNNYVSNNTAYQDALQNQTQALASAQDTINSAQNSLTQAQLTLQSKTAPPTSAAVTQAQAQIENAQAQLASAEVNYDNNIIKSPFDGVVAQLNNQAGDQVTSSTVVATIITNQELAIVSLNEVDASKITVGEKANVTFDAINGLSIAGTVAEIDTLGTVSQGVVTYTAKIGFDTQDPRVKPGMTASAEIITNEKTDVIAVPSSAVKTDASGASYVQMLDATGQPQNKTVQVGISDDTNTEITSGLNVGDMVVTQTIVPTKTSAATTTRTGTASIIPGLGGGGGAAGGGRVFTGGAGGGAGAARGN